MPCLVAIDCFFGDTELRVAFLFDQLAGVGQSIAGQSLSWETAEPIVKSIVLLPQFGWQQGSQRSCILAGGIDAENDRTGIVPIGNVKLDDALRISGVVRFVESLMIVVERQNPGPVCCDTCVSAIERRLDF